MSDYEDDPTWLSLCAAVIAAVPGDDLPRLVAADWLDENGQSERAELIRLQCGSDRRNYFTPPGAGVEFQLPNNPMFHDAPVSVAVVAEAIPNVRLTSQRGFLVCVDCKWAEWDRHGPWLAKRHPLASVVITDKQPTSYSHRWEFRSAPYGPPGSSSDLPYFLYSHFPKYERPGLGIHAQLVNYPVIQFLSRKEAHAALSVAAISWARAFVPPSPEQTQDISEDTARSLRLAAEA